MGFFDGLGSKLKDTVSSAATGATANVFDYFNSTAQDALVKVGVAPSGNLTEAEIEAGKTGAPPQLTVVPTKTPSSALSNAGSITVMNTQIPILAVAGAALAVYFLMKRK